MKKVLMIASVASMIDQFNMNNIYLLIEMGYEVHVACNFIEGNTCTDEKIAELKNKLNELGVKHYQIDFARNVFKINQNIKAYRQILKLLTENQYEFIHCHSPIGGVCGRLAAHKEKVKVIYTAHGFHFYKGAPVFNWLIYYPIECFLARYTDVLITINKEDYARAKKHIPAGKIEYIPGIGVDTEKLKLEKFDIVEKRKELGIAQDEIMIVSIGELNQNKNHEIIIKAIAKLKNENIHYVIAGKGDKKERLAALASELGVKLHLMGFRTDVIELLNTADIYAFPSFREGLSVALMEAMAVGLPVVCSKIRGNVDLIVDDKGGYLCKPDDEEGFTDKIELLVDDQNLRVGFSEYNQLAIKEFDVKNVIIKTEKIYYYIANINN